MRYPHRSTLDGPPVCEFCGISWHEVVRLLRKYKTWARMPDCPARKHEVDADVSLPPIDPATFEAAWTRHVTLIEGELHIDIDEFCQALGLAPTPAITRAVVFQISAAFGHPVISEVQGGPLHPKEVQ